MSNYNYVWELVTSNNVILRGYANSYSSAYAAGINYLDDPEEWKTPGMENVFPQLRIGKVAEFALCAGRHEMPVGEAIFEQIANPNDYCWMEKQANSKLEDGIFELHVYVTGLTAAMLAVTNVCIKRNIRLIAHHYNPTTGKYHEQVVVE